MDSSRVFILGAGFSAQAGIPLATGLTPLLRRKFEEYDDEEALEWFASLDERVRWIKRSDEDASPSLNIEEVFDFAHFDALLWKMRQHMCPVGRNSGDTPFSTGEAIETWLSYMEDDLVDVIWNLQKTAGEGPSGISQFVSILQEDDTIVTFNYDTLVEQSISQANRRWQYGFKDEGGQGIQILKMHGSINWAIVPRDQVDNFGYPLLFRKEDKNRPDTIAAPIGEAEYDCALLRIPDDGLANRIENRILQRSEKQYGIGIAGLGQHKPLDKMPGSGRVWHNARHALYQADEIYVVGFSLSPFDTMARLHFAGVTCERAERHAPPERIVLVDPYAPSLKANFESVFGMDPPIETVQERAESVNWGQLLRQ